MFLRLFTKEFPHKFPRLKSVVILLQPVEVSDGKNIRKTSEFKPFDIADSLREFTSSDFSISSLSSVGALSKLKTTYMANMSSMNVADGFENLNLTPDVSQ